MRRLSKFNTTVFDFYGPANDGIGGAKRICFDCGGGLDCIEPDTIISSLKHLYCPECLKLRKGEWRSLVLDAEKTLRYDLIRVLLGR